MKLWANIDEAARLPVGGICFHDLNRYLMAIGRRQFRNLSSDEIRQYVLTAMFDVGRKYTHVSSGRQVNDLQTFWEEILSGRDHIALLPDSEEGREYHAKSGVDTILFSNVSDVKGFMRKTFLNQIFHDMKSDTKHARIKVQMYEDMTRSRNRCINQLSHTTISIDAFADHLDHIRKMTDVTSALEILARMRVKPLHRAVFEKYFLEGCTTEEVSTLLRINQERARKIRARVKASFMKTWKQIHKKT